MARRTASADADPLGVGADRRPGWPRGALVDGGLVVADHGGEPLLTGRGGLASVVQLAQAELGVLAARPWWRAHSG